MNNAEKLLEMADKLQKSAELSRSKRLENKDILRKLYYQHYMSHVHNNKDKHDKVVKKILALNGHHDCFSNIDKGCESW
jgi:hypothetical protein